MTLRIRPRDGRVHADVLTHPALADRSVERVAARLGVSPDTVREMVYESPRLRLRNVLLGWHVVELYEPTEDMGA